MKKLITILSLFIAFCSVGQIDTVYIQEPTSYCESRNINLYFNESHIDISGYDCSCEQIDLIVKFDKKGNYTTYENYTFIDSNTILISINSFKNNSFFSIENNNYVSSEYYNVSTNFRSFKAETLNLEFDSLIVCEFGKIDIDRTNVTFNNNNNLLHSLGQVPNSIITPIHNSSTNTYFNYLTLKEGDSVYFKYNGEALAVFGGCVGSLGKTLISPTYIVTKKQNQIINSDLIIQDDSTICPNETISLINKDQTLTKYRWYNKELQNIISYNNDSISVDKAGEYIFASSNSIISNECPFISTHIISENKKCTITSFNEFSTSSSINSYPNPVKNKLKFKTGSEASLIIFNTIGDMMVNTSIDNKSIINTESWASGVYYYQITDANGTTVSDKFVKE